MFTEGVRVDEKGNLLFVFCLKTGAVACVERRAPNEYALVKAYCNAKYLLPV